MKQLATLLLTICSFTLNAQVKFTSFDINPGSAPSSPKYFAEVNGKLIFTATDLFLGNEVWIGDGTKLGCSVLKDINTFGDSNPIGFTLVNNKLFFTANDSLHGQELWITDGTTNGTQLVKDIWPGVKDSRIGLEMIEYNGKLLFIADDSLNGSELWISDGTANGTKLLKDIYQGVGKTSAIKYFTPLKGKIYFRADDGTNGGELWETDGTEMGTKMVKDIITGAVDGNPKDFYPFNGKIYFTARDNGNLYDLWTTDGTDTGTKFLHTITTSDYIAYNGKLYFYATKGVGRELWVTDGTNSGTTVVKDVYTGTTLPAPYSFASIVYKGKLYFITYEEVHGTELWVTDGTEVGTTFVKDIFPGTKNSNIANFFIYEDVMYFTADDDVNNRQLYMSNGTDTGTHLIAPPSPRKDALGKSTEFFVYNSAVYFAGQYATEGIDLWRLKVGPDGILNTKKDNTTMTVYPNPAQDMVIISNINKNDQVRISNITGQLITTPMEIQGDKLQINTTTLPKGIYIVRSGNKVANFIKQ